MTTKNNMEEKKDKNLKLRNPYVIFVLGGPGAGKGTQCANLVDRYGFCHLSAGDLLRAERNDPKSKDGELIRKYIKEGAIVPAKITVNLLKQAMINKQDEVNIFLIDGFPRDWGNVQCFYEQIPEARVQFVLFFDAPDDVLTERILSRAAASEKKRDDDHPDIIPKRLKTYRDSSMPVVEYFRKLNKVKTVDADKGISEIFKIVKKIVTPVVGKFLLDRVEEIIQSVMKSDWKKYKYYVDEDVTSFEPEAIGQLIKGLKFHEYYFEGSFSKSASNICSPNIKVCNGSAVVAYTRLIQKKVENKFKTSSYNETRVFELNDDGLWKMVHLHRSSY